jgi:hypothetical protein
MSNGCTRGKLCCAPNTVITLQLMQQLLLMPSQFNFLALLAGLELGG